MKLPNFPDKPYQLKNFIGNEFIQASGAEFEIHSPHYGKVIGTGKQTTSSDLENMVSKAKQAQIAWGNTPIKERTIVLFNLREVLIRRCDEISEMVSLENGKTLTEARAGLMKGIEVLEFALSIQNLDTGAQMEVSRGVTCAYRREASGIVANITPFNFPAMVPMWTMPIALVLGNAYILKPSDKTPLTASLLAEAFQEAGLPSGLLAVAHGGVDTVNAIIDHPEISAVGFVGSTKIAQIVYERASKNGKKILALGGAKNHIILLPDADPEVSGVGISDSFTGCAGQRCMAASVLLAVGEVGDQIAKIKSRAESLVLGSDMGALISSEQVEFLKDAISKAEAAGAKIILDGRNVKAPENCQSGYWLGPTIIEISDQNSEVATKELFGPILTIYRCDSLSQALEIENKNPYGNACSVFTTSGGLAEEVIQKSKAGMVGINIGVPVPREPFSFGGIEASKFGQGDITGANSLLLWSHHKKITTKWQMQKDHNWMS
ncbi:MAG: aldehyde dehydrogenase family protein [Halobacteriovoraceae bacterium]|jgi:malonate-semialdehyde dehydrogenase (acetylating) / methylmalonate-semialdehyde dehydrogenase|nr:aldehyde dehydrogenase family protein [Halobacteriovoraceae bacterium]